MQGLGDWTGQWYTDCAWWILMASSAARSWWQTGRKGEKCVKEARNKEKGSKERNPLRILLHKLPSLQLSALQCDITYYFYHHPQRMRYRNVVQESERQDDWERWEPNQKRNEKRDRGERLAERKSGGVWMKEIPRSKKQMDKLMVQWSASLSNAICQCGVALQ